MYTGICELVLQDQEVADLYEGKDIGCAQILNQYVIVKNTLGQIIDKGRWTESGFTKLKYKKLKNDMFGEVKPKNSEQEFMFDALQNEGITGVLVSGGFGTGKTMISLCHALDQVIGAKPRYDRIIFLRNNVEVKNTVPLGALPGGLIDKIKPYAMSMADIIGSITALDDLIEQEKIVLDHIGFIRGRSFKNSLVILSEAQNVTREHMALVVARIGSGSRLFVEGDLRQSDKQVFEKDCGMYYMAEMLKGDPEFSMITLQKNERSRFASLSDKILGVEE